MIPRDLEYRQRTFQALAEQPFATLLGMEAVGVGEGWFEVKLLLTSHHLQHDGIVHGGVVASIADTCLALAALTLVGPGERVVTIEFKINYLRAAHGEWLRCRGQVIRPGRSISVSEVQVFAESNQSERLVATALGTIAILPPLDTDGER